MGGNSYNATENSTKATKTDPLQDFDVILSSRFRFLYWKVSKQTMTSNLQNEIQQAAIVPVAENGLPSPADLPEAMIVIYDGKCKFCTKQVKRLQRWDGKNRLSFVSLHDPFVTTCFPELTHEKLLEQMFVIDQSGTSFGGAAAFQVLTRKLPRLWILAPLLHIPFTLPIWQWMYMQVARRRYQLDKEQGEICEGDSCDIHFGKKS